MIKQKLTITITKMILITRVSLVTDIRYGHLTVFNMWQSTVIMYTAQQGLIYTLSGG